MREPLEPHGIIGGMRAPELGTVVFNPAGGLSVLR